MKKIVWLVLLLLIVCLSDAEAFDDKFGAGGIIGAPSGVSAKYIFEKYAAADAGFGWTTLSGKSLELHTDFLVNNYSLLDNFFDIKGGDQLLYTGLGMRMKFENKIINNNTSTIGVRLPLGASYYFKSTPLEIFLEVAFIFDFVRSTAFDFQGGVGARYYFF